jgi:tetratricopeptide (TPR) repeat protein
VRSRCRAQDAGLGPNVPLDHRRVLELQRTVGNAAVARLVVQRDPAPKPPAGGARATTVEDSPNQAEAQQWLTRGVHALNSGQYAEAVSDFDQGFVVWPSRAFILNKASAYLDWGQFTEAEREYTLYLADPDPSRVAEVEQSLERARDGLRQAEARTAFDAATASYASGGYEDALAGFEQANDLYPKAEFVYNQAASLEKLGRKYAAADRYEAYLGQSPGAADAAKVTAHIGKLRQQADGSPITLDGRAGAQEWMTRGVRLLREKSYNAAINAFDEGFRTWPSASFILNKASTLNDAGRFEEAILEYEQYLSDPEAPRADEAKRAMEEARLKIGGGEPTYAGIEKAGQAFEQATKLYEAQDYQGAFDLFEKAHQGDHLAAIRYNQAACMDKLDKWADAITFYRMYLSDAPDAPDRERVAKRIKSLSAKQYGAAGAVFDKAQDAYLDSRYKEAAAGFAEAYSILPKPEFLYNEAASYDKDDDPARAVQLYSLYLQAAPDANDADRVRTRIHTLQAKTGDDLMAPGS